MSQINDQVRSDPRMAGSVVRWHTWPTIRTQTVAEASWNVARILVMIWPDAPAQAITHALLNDCGEVRSGDLPFPIKRDNPLLKAQITSIETESLHEQGILYLSQAPADDVWRGRVKICDMIEMWEFGLTERCLGSVYCEGSIEDVGRNITDLQSEFLMDLDDTNRIQEYMTWRLARTPRPRT